MDGPVFNGRLFGPGLATGGVDVQVVLSTQVLSIRGGAEQRVSLSALQSRAGGFQHDQLNLGWTSSAGQYELLIAAPERDAFLAQVPEALREVMQPYRRSVFFLNSKLGLLGSIAAMLVLALGLFAWQYDNVVAWTAAQVPMKTERQIGALGLDAIREEFELNQDSSQARKVEALGTRLTSASRYDYQWYVADTDDVNAMALPGGIVVVFRGLVDSATSAEELAGVIAHEVQHIEQRHSLRHLINSAGLAALLAVALGDVSGVVAILAHQIGAMYFSRELEAEADRAGIAALHAAEIDPRGLVTFFARLDDADEAAPAALEYISTHPATAARIEAAEAIIAGLPQRDYPALELSDSD